MAEKWTPVPGCTREEEAVGLTRFLLRKHYRESNAAADESIFDEPFFWFGAAVRVSSCPPPCVFC